MDTAKHWDDFYKKPLSGIPWEITEPPKELVELVEKKTIPGNKVLDIACGTGNYSIYLAKNGFEVSGIDLSERAINIAKKSAENEELKIDFLVGDVGELDNIFPNNHFDFILDYSLLHHMSPENVRNHSASCLKILKPGGKLLLVCYNELHKLAKSGGSAEGKYGNIMYFRTADEIREIYKAFNELSYKQARLGKGGKHPAHSFLFIKPDAL